MDDTAQASGSRSSERSWSAGVTAGWLVALVGALLSCAPTRVTEQPPRPPGEVEATGSDCLIGNSATGSGCVVTSQQPVLQIPGTGSGNVYIVDGSSPDQNNAWVSDTITLSPSSACGGNTCFRVPVEAGLLPRHSYQWTFIAAAQGASEAPRPAETDPTVTWRGFTINYVRAGREPTDSFGPLSIGLASGAAQTQVQSQAVQTASGTVQLGLSHRGFYNGTPTGEPWFIEDPAGALPVGWVFTGVDANVPWVRITAVDGVGGSGTRAVTLQAFDGSLLEYTNTGTGGAGWAPPVGVGRPAGAYGSLSQSSDGSTFTWTSGTTIVSFVQSASEPTVWLAKSSQEILPGSDTISPGLQVSWDAQGRLATIADQTSVNSSGTATRVAHFYSGGDSHCPTPTASGLVGAPAGMLCAFESLDGTIAQVFYRQLTNFFGDYQLGQVVLPGGAVWSFEWQTTNITLSDNTQIAAPQLLSVQSGNAPIAARVVCKLGNPEAVSTATFTFPVGVGWDLTHQHILVGNQGSGDPGEINSAQAFDPNGNLLYVLDFPANTNIVGIEWAQAPAWFLIADDINKEVLVFYQWEQAQTVNAGK